MESHIPLIMDTRSAMVKLAIKYDGGLRKRLSGSL